MSTLTTILNKFQTDADNNRADIQEKRMDIYLDCYEGQIKTLLQTQFTPENFKVLLPMIATYDNVFKKIINLKARTYKDTPLRKWLEAEKEIQDEENPELPVEDQEYSKLISKSNLDSEMISLEKFSFVNNIAFLRLIPNPNIGIMDYEAIAPENVSIEQDDANPLLYNALMYRLVKNNTSGKQFDRWILWTNGKASMDDDDFKTGFSQIIDVRDGMEEIGEKKPNKFIDVDTSLGIIPFVDFRTVRGVDFWAETMNEDLRNGTLQINVNQTHHNNLMKFAGYRQLFITGDIDTSKLHNQKSDVATMINITPVQGQTVPSVQTEEMAKDPNELLTAIMRVKAILSDNHGVSFSADSLASGQKQTAEAMTINRQQILELRKDVLPMFRQSESILAKYTVIIANTSKNDGGLGLVIDIAGRFQIDYKEPKVVVDEKVELETDIIKMSQELTSKTDLVRKYNPDIKSEVDATAFILNNRKINNRLSTEADLDTEVSDAILQTGSAAVPEVENAT